MTEFSVPDLKIISVLDRGQPNLERVAIRVVNETDMTPYGLLVGLRNEGVRAWPLNDNFLWFGNGIVQENDWIFAYTGPGTPRKDELPSSGSHLYTVHWGRKKTMFNSPEVVPILFRIDATDILIDPPALEGQS